MDGTVKKASVATRESTKVFGLGSAITEQDSQINGTRLPTCLQVLRCFMWHTEDGKLERRSRWESAKLVLQKVTPFYGKANIPIISERKAIEKIIKLADDNSKLRSIPINRRTTPASITKVNQMEMKFMETFPLWPNDASSHIKNPEDLAFLESMKTDRCATFGCQDKLLADKMQRKVNREEKESEASKYGAGVQHKYYNHCV